MGSRAELEFIGKLYDAALGRTSWQAVVTSMADVIGSQTSSLIAHDPLRDRTGILGMHCLTDDYVEVYGQSFFGHDLWTHEALRRRHYNKSTLGTELVSEKDWERSVIYNEFLRPRTDAFHLVGGMVHLAGGGVLAIGCHRPRSTSAFTVDHQAVLARLLPHLQRAASVHQRLEEAEAAVQASPAEERFADAVIQVAADGRILRASAAAESILTKADGLVRSNGKLRARNTDTDIRLQKLIGQAAATTAASEGGQSGGALQVARSSGIRGYSVLVSPIGLDRSYLSKNMPAAIVLISDPTLRRPIDTRVLRELYGLSPAEAQLAARLTAGESLRAIAEATDVSINTVRTLLMRTMAKTETSTQLELVRLILTGPAGWHWRR